ncbi:hypothetical protein LUZ63_010426 [Rhynchospora breviuscula]|uniref:Serine aminopeptidase S33 domain-containing protein n=1 Tax=Rhynchospora breviuscula TaxID=2022672 RepID=A0A9Q0CH01_9POAL|nr:hypothetical protein LUZ63_010426 [Rhynchospora breviuscula]
MFRTALLLPSRSLPLSSSPFLPSNSLPLPNKTSRTSSTCWRSGLDWRNTHKVLLAAVDKLQEMAQQDSPETRITITSEHGEKLVGILHDTGSKKIVILCHGLRDTKDHNTVVSIASALTRIEISSFRFDFSGNGESEGQFQFGNYWKEVDDLHSVTSYLKKNYDIIAVVGHSKGGNVVLLYASKYDDVKMVINVSARFDLQRGIKERLGEGFFDRLENDKTIQLVDGKGRFEVTKDSLMDRLSINMSEEVKKIKPDARVLTIHGSNDEVILVEDAYEFEKVICNHKLYIIDGANHNYTLHNDELASVVVDAITSSHL